MAGEAAQCCAVTIGPAEAGARLDKALGVGLAGFTRSRIQALIRTGQVTLAGATVSGYLGAIDETRQPVHESAVDDQVHRRPRSCPRW